MQIPVMAGENEVYGQQHSLFVEERPRTMEPLRDEEDKIVEGYYEEHGGYKIYKLFLGDFSETGNGIQRIINKLQGAGPDDVLEFHIASRGGEVDELVQFYNLCNTMFHGRVTTFANHAYSAGAWAFLMGTDRIAYEHTSFMLHSYAGGFGGKRQDLLDHMEHEDRRLNTFLMGTLKDYFSKKELKKMNKGKDFWMNTEEMCERGIATHVLKDGDVLSAEEYLELKHPERKEAREKREAEEAEANAKLEKELKKKLKKEAKKTKKLKKEAKDKKTKES
jgi:ATP-dependent protease ClpP protease subunit